MGILSLTSEQLRYKMKHLNELCPNRSVTNDDEFYELYSKLRDVIEDTNYNRKSNKKERFVSKSTQLIS